MAQGMAGAGMPQGQQGVPIAQQVMQQAVQADQPQGLEALPSNLPQEYAGGGIIAFEHGGAVQRFNEGLLVDKNYPDSYYRSQAAEVQPDPKSMEAYVAQYKALMPPKGATQTEYEEYLRKRSGDAEATKKQDLNLALAQFGLNLAAGKSPRALENLGEAGIKALPAVQEAYKQRRLADETSLRGRAELERMARAEEIDALKGGLGLYGKERELTAEAEKAEKQRENAIKVAQLQMAHKPTDLGNYVNDYVAFNLKDPKNTKSVEQLKVEAYDKYPGYVVRENAIQASKEIAGGAQALTGAGQALTAEQLRQQALDKAADNFSKALENRRDPITIESNRLKKLDKENRENGNPTNLQLEHRNKIIRDNADSMMPSSQQSKVVPPPVAAPTSTAPKGAAPSISSVAGAPAGSRIGAYTQNGWEVKDKNGKLLGYTRSN